MTVILPSAGAAPRAIACSRLSVVSTPKITGVPVASATRWIPAAHSPATKSKCAVSPRITAPRQITASHERASRCATSGISNAPGTQCTGTSSRPSSRSVSSAPSSSGFVTWSLNRPATIATRIPLASSVPSYSLYSPMFWSRSLGAGIPGAALRDVRLLLRAHSFAPLSPFAALRDGGRSLSSCPGFRPRCRGGGPSSPAWCAGSGCSRRSGERAAAPARRSRDRSPRARRTLPDCWS